MTSGPRRSARLVTWARAWRGGTVSYDDVADATESGEEHLVADAPGTWTDVPLREAVRLLSRLHPDEIRLVAIGDVEPAASHGAWIGLLHLGRDGAGWLREAITASRADGTLRDARLSDLLMRVVAAGRPVRVVYTRGGWVNVNNLTDLLDATTI